MPGVVSSGGTEAGRFWPRRAVVMKARVPPGPGEDDVARLVADQQRAHDARRRRADVDDADAVGEMVDHPHLGVGARRDRHRLEPDRHRADVRQPAAVDGEDLEPIVRAC